MSSSLLIRSQNTVCVYYAMDLWLPAISKMASATPVASTYPRSNQGGSPNDLERCLKASDHLQFVLFLSLAIGPLHYASHFILAFFVSSSRPLFPYFLPVIISPLGQIGYILLYSALIWLFVSQLFSGPFFFILLSSRPQIGSTKRDFYVSRVGPDPLEMWRTHARTMFIVVV